MSSELGHNDINEFKNKSVDNFKNIKPKKEMTSKEVNDYWKNEFDKEKQKSDLYVKSDHLAENDKQDVFKKDIAELSKDYIDDLKSKSEYADTIPENALDPTTLELQPSDKVAEKREEFDDNKARLRKEWETLNHKEWPKYKEDVVNDEGKVIRRAGDNYDAHHIQPLQLGGENVASNITPLDMNSHKEIHSSVGSCTSLVERVKGGQ